MPLFTDEFVAAMERRLATGPEHFRPQLWRHATDPNLEPLRQWLERELQTLNDEKLASSYASRLRDSKLHTQALAELATGHALRQPGYRVQYEPALGNLTPDLRLTSPDGCQMLLEVWRRGLSGQGTRRNNAWAQLARTVQRIPIPVAISVESTSHEIVEPPDDAARQALLPNLRRWLKFRIANNSGLLVHGDLRFRVVGATTTGHAELMPMIDGASADRDDVVGAIERKERKYRRLVKELAVPFVVVLSADHGTALSAEHAASVLEGKNTLTMSIPLWGAGAVDSGQIEMRQTDAPPTFDPTLSGVAWLDVNDGANALVRLLWANPDASWPVRQLPPPQTEAPR